MDLTEKDIELIVSQVLDKIKKDSVRIEDLARTNVLVGDDLLELNNGRSVSLDDLKSFIKGLGIYLDILGKDSTEIPTDMNVFSALRTLSEINKSAEESKKIYLRKDQQDITMFLLQLLGGIITTYIKSDNFTSGALGTGYCLLKENTAGKSYLEVDNLFVRLKAVFSQLEVLELAYSGGNYVFGPAGARCTKVEEYDDYYRCYFTADDGSKKVKNKFRVEDQVQCRESNIEEGVHENVSNKYYWRLCVGIGDDYIDLSKTVRDMSSDDAPSEGDSMVTIGNQKDITRQNVIIISVYGEGSPSIIRYQGIDSFSMEGKAIKSEYYDASTGRYKEITYGDKYTGAPDASSFIEFIQGKGVSVKGQVDIQPGSKGWENIAGLPDSIQTAVDAADAAKDIANQAQSDADDAKQEAADAAGRLDDWASDSTISPTEKLALKQEAANLQSEYDTNIANANRYGLDTTAYANAWKAYKAELEYHSADTPENIDIRPALQASQAAFYTERETILTAIATAAKEYADKLVDSLAVGSENLLLNTGFTGNYNVPSVSASTKLSAVTALYSDKLEHWSGTGTVVEDHDSMSGYACQLGSLTQGVSLILGERYVISYRAKGSSVNVSCGGYSGTDSLSESYETYTHKFTYEGGGVFMVSGTATVCEIKLERGTVRTDWCPSRNDTNPVADSFKHLWYLQDALQGSSQFLGGLMLSTMIMLGKYTNGVMDKVNAGVSGVYNDDTDVAFWAGGTFEQAIATVQKLIHGDEPSDEEWKTLANFVATHGGDVFLRGYIYALGGIFRGKVIIGSGSTGFENLEDKPDMDAIYQDIENAQTAADKAQESANAASDAVSDLENNVEGAFKDGIISEAEAIAISKYINQVNESFGSLQATYGEVYNNSYLEGTAKTTLAAKYTALVSKKDALIKAINDAIADSKTTAAESKAVDNAFAAYNTAVKEYQTAIEQANEAIQDKIKSFADDAHQAAIEAQEAADEAKEDAAQANGDLANFKADNIISPVEKTALKQQLADINSEYSQIISEANRYGVPTTNYTSAYNSAKTALAKYTAASPEFITVGNDYANISAYYSARQTILDAIAAKAKEYAEDVSMQSKNDLAQKIGYDSYDDMVTEAGNRNTIIENGRIRTSLIDAKNIVTSNLMAEAIATNGLAVGDNTTISKGGIITTKKLTATEVDLTGKINATSGTFKGAVVRPWTTATYKRIYSTSTVDVWGYDASLLSYDRVRVKTTQSGELLIPWGDNADGRELYILVESSVLPGADLEIKVPAGQKILIDNVIINGDGGSTLTLDQKYLYHFIGFKDMWIARIISKNLGV